MEDHLRIEDMSYRPRLRQDIPMEDHLRIEDMLPDIEGRFRGLRGELGGSVMGLSDRVKKQVRRDSERGGPDPQTEFEAKLEQRKMMRQVPASDPTLEDIDRMLGSSRRSARRRASGGIIGLQAGGIPANYAAPQAYGGYGMPAAFTQRQEYLSPEVAQQYADLTRGIMRAGTRGYEDVRYRGPQLAGFTGMEAAAQAGAGAYGMGAGPRGTLQAASTIGEAARGVGSMVPRQQALAAQYGAMAPQALQQAQAGATGMQQLAERAQLQGQLAGAGMRGTGAAAQAEQQALGVGQAAAGTAGQAQMAGLGGQAGELGADIRGQLGGTGVEARQIGQIGAGDIRQAGLESQQLGQQALAGIGAAGGRAEEASAEAAQRMRDIGGRAPELQRGADLSQYMSQYTAGVTDPQLRQLMEFQRMQGQELGSQAAQAGAFGGSRADVEQRKLREQTGQQAAEIIGKGQQEAFQSAQQAFQADRAAQQQAQQMGLSAEQQAAAAQQAGTGAAQQAAAQGFGAAQQGQAARQAAAQQAVQAQQQGIAALQQAQVAGGSAAQQAMGQQLQAAQQGVGMGMQGLAAQQAAAARGAQFGLQGQQQGFGAAQQGITTGLTGLQAAQQARQQGFGTAADLLGGRQRAMGAEMGAYGQLAGIGGQQMGLGGQQQAEQMARFDMMNRYGGQQRRLQQAGLDIAKAEHEKAMQYPERQIGWMSQQLGALPYQNIVSEAAYAPQQGPLSTTLGALAGGQEAAAEWRGGQPSAPMPQSSGQSGGTPAATPFSPTITPPVPGTYQGAVPKPPKPQIDFGSATSFSPGVQPWQGFGSQYTATGPNQRIAGTGATPWASGGLIRGYQGGGYMPPYGSARSGMAGGVAGAGMARVGMAGGGYLPFYGRVNR